LKRINSPLLFFALFLFVIFAVNTSSLPAQNLTTGALSGTVTDPSGASVPDADVTARNDATGEARQTKTNDSGQYTFPLLKPGQYTVTVEKEGFRTVNTKTEVLIGQTSTVSSKLEVGSTTQSVEV
jgi:hypothetical protein